MSVGYRWPGFSLSESMRDRAGSFVGALDGIIRFRGRFDGRCLVIAWALCCRHPQEKTWIHTVNRRRFDEKN